MRKSNNQRQKTLDFRRVVLPDRISENTTLVLADGIIVDIEADRRSPERHYDELDDVTLFPGFIDVHIHGAKGSDTLAASGSDLLSVSEYLATQGVTAWLPTLVPASDNDYERAINSIALAAAEQRRRLSPPTARILGVHYEGPFVNESQCGALRKEHFKTFSSAADVDRFPLPQFENAARMMTLAPETSGGVELISELVRRGWIVSIGHTRADVHTLDRALSAGARHMTHFMNAMAPLHHRAPGPIGWGLLRDDVTCDFIADGIHLDPIVLELLLRTKGAARLSLISDAIAAAGMGDGDYPIWGETIHVENGRTSNAHGSIAGSVISMNDAVRRMRSLGTSDVELALMAATNSATLLRMDKHTGSIEIGKRADFVALDENGEVKLTIIGGEVAFSTLS